MIAFLISPLGKLLGVALLVASLAGACAMWLHAHDSLIVAQRQAAADKAIAAATIEDQARMIAALQAQATKDAELVRQTDALRSKTHSVPTTSACLGSPAVRALIDGLRNPPSGPSAPLKGP